VGVLRFGQLFVREMGIQVADGWGWFLFHPLTLGPRRKYKRRSDLPEMASLRTVAETSGTDSRKLNTTVFKLNRVKSSSLHGDVYRI
jgi:hypothetical protein